MIFFNKICKNNVLVILFIYITTHKDFMMHNSCCFEIENEHKIMYINFLKLCSFNFIFDCSENMYNNLLKYIHFINNFLIFYMFNDLCFYIVINMKHIKKLMILKNI